MGRSVKPFQTQNTIHKPQEFKKIINAPVRELETEDCISKTQEKHVLIEVDQYLDLIDNFNQKQKKFPPSDYIITQILLQGNEYSKESAFFKGSFEIHVLSDKNWVKAEILPISASVKSYTIEKVETEMSTQLEKKATKLRKQSPKTENFIVEKESTHLRAYLGVIDDKYCLLSLQKGFTILKLNSQSLTNHLLERNWISSCPKQLKIIYLLKSPFLSER